ncbi:acetate--CoA ligase family protein [Dasania marina]|uniref:acetate--CoA ligase family protein n=1 Tax=Dasania marina TaxID=471499 RepID=UPI000365C37B|nr:acetate--CoA ligase family protein [Dasania marina]
MANKENMRRLLAPKTIAFVGGSAMADAVIRCKKGGFAGEIWLVNPVKDEINGVKCYPSVKDLPSAPDATFIGTKRDITIPIVKELNDIGAGGAVCYASGFAEMDSHGENEGELKQQELLAAAGDLAILGPNCYGLLDYLHGSALWPVAHGGKMVEQGMAIITQSGNFAYNISMIDRSLPIAYMVSVGNQAQVDVAGLIDAFLEEPRVTAIGLHLEGLKNVPNFAAAAMRALEKGVPIVALKTGTSAMGAEMALSHTSSLAGSDDLYNALFDRVGIARVTGPVSFVETLKIFACGAVPKGNRLVALASSGGDAGLIADYSDNQGIALPKLSAGVTKNIAELLPAYANVANPLDFTTAIWGDRDALTKCMDNLFSDGYDFCLLPLDFPGEASGENPQCELIADVFQACCKKHNVPGAIASVFPELMQEKTRQHLHSIGVPALQGLEDAVTAIGKVMAYSQRRQDILNRKDESTQALCPADELNGEAIAMDEWDSKQWLQKYGLPVPAAKLVNAAEAEQAAAELGCPVVVKMVSKDLPHKTEAGAVKVNIKTPAEAAAVAQEMVTRLSLSHPQLDTSRILIEKMSAAPVTELIVGIKREQGFGLSLVIGAGGILVELMKESVSLLLPTSRDAVRDAIKQLKVYKLIEGFRGKEPGDLEATVDAVMAVANFAVDNADKVLELDVNPLMVLPQGQGAVAVDALISRAE